MSDKNSWQFLDDLKHRKEKPKEEKVGQIEGLAPQFWEQAPPLKKNGQFRGQKHLEYVPEFFHSFWTYTKFTFCKKNWSKTTNPAFSSGPNNLLPLIWGSHHQLDYQSSWATN